MLELAVFEMKRRRVTLQFDGGQPPAHDHGRPILIEQVLLNLLKNAAEAIDSGQAAIARAATSTCACSGGTSRIKVRWWSSPSPTVVRACAKTMLARLFEAFHSTKAEGLGIGLSLCRSIIESHHGRIKAENIYNGQVVMGCRFTFTLPIDNCDEADTGLPFPTDLLAEEP